MSLLHSLCVIILFVTLSMLMSHIFDVSKTLERKHLSIKNINNQINALSVTGKIHSKTFILSNVKYNMVTKYGHISN